MKTPALKILLFTGLAMLTMSLCRQDAVLAQDGHAQSNTEAAFLLTIFLRHDESKTLQQIDQHLRDTGYYKQFPPQGIEVVSWYVMMGIGQVVTLRVPQPDFGRSTPSLRKRPGVAIELSSTQLMITRPWPRRSAGAISDRCALLAAKNSAFG